MKRFWRIFILVLVIGIFGLFFMYVYVSNKHARAWENMQNYHEPDYWKDSDSSENN